MSVCRSRSGRIRHRHDWDKDGRCVFCDHVNEGVPIDSLPDPLASERRLKEKLREADARAAVGYLSERATQASREKRCPNRTPKFTDSDRLLLQRMQDGEEGEDE